MISYKDMRNQQERLSLQGVYIRMHSGCPIAFSDGRTAREVLDLSVCTGAKVFAMSWWDTRRIS